MKQPHVLILYTGGTLGMSPKPGAPLQPAEAHKDLLTWVPELKEYATIDVEILANIDSSLMTPEIWLMLARRIEQAQEEKTHSGVLVIHCTDTLAFTSSALSFLLPGLNMPVVITGSQRPLAVTRTDARNNVLGAVETALEGPAEVLVFFRERAYRGNRITKSAISDFMAFASPNFPALGKAGINWEWNDDLFWPRTRRPTLWPEIPQHLPMAPLVIPWVPGLDFSALAPALERHWALLVEAFGSGNIPLDDGVSETLGMFMQRGGLVYVRSQVSMGRTDLNMYAPGQRLAQLGAVGVCDMTREAAVTKLMVLKASNMDADRISYYMTQSLAGELTESDML